MSLIDYPIAYYQMFWFLVLPLIGSDVEFCAENLNLGLYGSCEGYNSGYQELNFGGDSGRGFVSNLNPYNDHTLTIPAIFPCKVDKYAGKLVSFALTLPK